MSRRLFRSTSIIALATLASRLLGFGRDMIIARFFGTGALLDGFFVAFRIPNLFRRLVAEGSLTISFVPVYTEYLELHSEEEARELAQKTFSLLLIVLALIVGLGMVFSPLFVKLFGYGFTDTLLIKKTILLNRVMFPYLFFIGIVAFCMGYLNSHRLFFAPAFSPVLLNVGFIIGGVFLREQFGFPMMGLAVGVLLGGLMQVVLQLPFMVKQGFRARFVIDLKHPGIRKIGKMVGAAMIGGAVYQLNLLINTMLASLLPAGSISYLYYSDRLTEMVMGIFVVSIGNVMLPEMSTFTANKDIDGLKKAMRDSIQTALFFAIPAAVALGVSGRNIVTVLFMRGAFDAYSVANTYRAIQMASIGLSFLATYKMLVQSFYSLKDTKTPVLTGAVALCANAILGIILMRTSLQHAGLSLSNALAMAIQVALLFIVLRRKVGSLDLGGLVLPLLKIVVAAAFMGVVMYFVQERLWWDDALLIKKIAALALLVCCGSLAYGVSGLVLKLREINLLFKMLKKVV